MSEENACENLIIGYLFPPSDDISGIVQAKRVLADKKRVDVVVSDDANGSCRDFADVVDEYINEKIIIEMNGMRMDTPNSIMEFIKRGIEEIEKKNTDYKTIYSISWRTSNHFLALEYKLRHPDVSWTAEFSDPMLYDVFNRKRMYNLNNKDYINKINKEIAKLGNCPLIENPVNIYFIVEYLTYLFADKVIFTNENQREIMLSQHPVDIYDRVMEKSEISSAPTLDEKYYHINEGDVDFDENNINIAYFGSFYPNRHFESIFYAFDSLNHEYKDKIKLHLYVSDTNSLKDLIGGLDIEKNIIINDTVDYLDFLNLTTKFDVLIVNDLVSNNIFKINPYLPSKLSDYMGSGRDIWILYENGSVMSKTDVKYKSNVRVYSSSRDVLIQILEDNGYVDENLSFDEYYFDKRLTLLNKSLNSKDHEINRLRSQIRRLRTENKRLENAKNDVQSSKSSKITGKFKNLLNKF